MQNVDPQFYEYFSKYKAPIVITSMLPFVRKKAGISHNVKFTTNMSESINKVIKLEVEWKESRLPVLIDHLRAITDQHLSETEKAVISRGEWEFITQYAYLKICEPTWFTLSKEAKEKHMKKILTCELETPIMSSKAGTRKTESKLSITVEESGVKNIAESTLRNIWEKADNLLKSEGSILTATWISDAKARLVKSSSSPHPHLVRSHGKKGLYCCDQQCPMYKGFSLCSHVIAVAQHNGDLCSFLANLNGNSAPNLTAIATQGLLTGTAGRKGGKAER